MFHCWMCFGTYRSAPLPLSPSPERFLALSTCARGFEMPPPGTLHSTARAPRARRLTRARKRLPLAHGNDAPNGAAKKSYGPLRSGRLRRQLELCHWTSGLPPARHDPPPATARESPPPVMAARNTPPNMSCEIAGGPREEWDSGHRPRPVPIALEQRRRKRYA